MQTTIRQPGFRSRSKRMSHAGMGPVFAQANELQPGHYESHLSFRMAGDWVILLHGTLPNGEKLERQFDVRDVRPN